MPQLCLPSAVLENKRPPALLTPKFCQRPLPRRTTAPHWFSVRAVLSPLPGSVGTFPPMPGYVAGMCSTRQRVTEGHAGVGREDRTWPRRLGCPHSCMWDISP